MAVDPTKYGYNEFKNDMDQYFFNTRELGKDKDSPAPIDRDTLLPSDGSGVYYLPTSGTTGKDVQGTSVSAQTDPFQAMEGLMSSQLTAYFDKIFELTERNTARSEAQASELRDWQERQNQIAMQFNSDEAAKNRDWQQMMSNTAHQREIADLQAAGLNPVLSAMGGNGASVTSGATASGVTSSGAKGEVDTSATSALVSLLGTMWSAQTQMEMQRNNAQTNLAIAEKQNASAQLIAQMYTSQAREASILSAQTSLSVSEIQALTSRVVSETQAAATRAAASMNMSASKYMADVSRMNALTSAEVNKAIAQLNVDQKDRQYLYEGINKMAIAQLQSETSRYGFDIGYSSAMDVANEHHKDNPYGTIQSAFQNIKSILSGARGSSFGGRSR